MISCWDATIENHNFYGGELLRKIDRYLIPTLNKIHSKQGSQTLIFKQVMINLLQMHFQVLFDGYLYD